MTQVPHLGKICAHPGVGPGIFSPENRCVGPGIFLHAHKFSNKEQKMTSMNIVNETTPEQVSSPIAPQRARSSRRSTLQLQSTSTTSNAVIQQGNGTSTVAPEEIDELERMAAELRIEEENEADGGDSDVEGAEYEIFDEAYIRSAIERQNNDDGGDLHIQHINNGNIAFVVGAAAVFQNSEEEINFDEKVIKPPDDWVRPAKKDPNEPDFDLIDNPGGWNDYIFRPVYQKSGRGNSATYKYVRHELPTGCSVVPPNNEGKRIANGWNFYYKGWKSEKFPGARDGATSSDLFPEARKNSLDKDVLVQLGLSVTKLKDFDTGLPDALFFYQLVLPISDTARNGIINDPRKSFFSEVNKFTNLYRCQKGIGMTYGHSFPEVTIAECVRWDGCLLRDGVRGGGNGAIYRRWFDDSPCSDTYCQKAMTLHRWNQLKRVYKLNNNDNAPMKGEPGYDPSYKYDMIYDVITSNVRVLTKNAELDLTGDETTWGFGGYGEKGAKVVYRVKGKPGVTKGGQTVLVSAVNRIRPYWYQHRHNMTARYGPGFTGEGPSEVRSCIDALEKMIVGRDGNEKKIFSKPPHITWDNFFSGEQVCHYAGRKGFGLTTTCRRDRLPKGVKGEYMHKGKTDVVTQRTKCAKYIEPVILVKEEDQYEIVHTSFQSTSSCNLMSVNAMSENKNFVEARTRGRKQNKRYYVIEQNLSRLLYLKTYSRIDSIDHMIKNANLKYRTWKYWHAPVNHAKGLALATAYDIYREVCEGHLIPNSTIKDPVDPFVFQDILSRQMCEYDPKKQKYLGDERMRAVVSMNKNARNKKRKFSSADGPDLSGHISKAQYKNLTKEQPKRICKDLSEFELHQCETRKNPAKCVVCGELAYKMCSLCKAPLHNMEVRGSTKGRNCFLHWHNQAYLGLCFDD